MSDQPLPLELDETPEPAVKIVTWKPLFEALQKTGLLTDPERTYRVVLDATVGELCRLTIWTYGDDRILEAVADLREAATGTDAIVR